MYYDCPTNAAVFEYWFQEKLSPENVAIMNNASFRRKGALRKIASRYHVSVLFLPPYSPDYNPIEKLWVSMER